MEQTKFEVNQQTIVIIFAQIKFANIMKVVIKNSKAIFMLLVLFIAGCSGTSPEYSGYRNALKNQMRDMFNVLNAGHKTEFIQDFVDPSYIKKVGGVDQALTQFSDSRASALQTALRIARNIEPTYDPSAKQMSYFSNSLQVPIVFKLIGGKWYLQDDWLKL